MDEACHFQLFFTFLVSTKMSKFAKWKSWPEVMRKWTWGHLPLPHLRHEKILGITISNIFLGGGFYYGYPKLVNTWVMNLLYIGRPYTKGRDTWGGIMCLQNCNNFTTSRREICEIVYCNIYVMPWDHMGHHLKLLNLRNLGFLIVILLDWHIGDKFSQSMTSLDPLGR